MRWPSFVSLYFVWFHKKCLSIWSHNLMRHLCESTWLYIYIYMKTLGDYKNQVDDHHVDMIGISEPLNLDKEVVLRLFSMWG